MVSIASYQPVGRVTHLSITLILQCSAQDCKSYNAKLQNLFQLPISQTVKNAWVHDTWDHGFKSYFIFLPDAVATTLNFGNNFKLLPKLSRLFILQKLACLCPVVKGFGKYFFQFVQLPSKCRCYRHLRHYIRRSGILLYYSDTFAYASGDIRRFCRIDNGMVYMII